MPVFSPPSNRGLCYFVGMFSVTTTMSQTIDLVVYRSAIDSGNVSLNLSAWLGGYNDQDDSATVSVDLFNRFFQPIGNRSSIGPVYASDRQNVTSMAFRQYSSMIPVSTRYLTTIVKLVRFATADNDGNADNIAVVFNLS